MRDQHRAPESPTGPRWHTGPGAQGPWAPAPPPASAISGPACPVHSHLGRKAGPDRRWDVLRCAADGPRDGGAPVGCTGQHPACTEQCLAGTSRRGTPGTEDGRRARSGISPAGQRRCRACLNTDLRHRSQALVAAGAGISRLRKSPELDSAALHSLSSLHIKAGLSAAGGTRGGARCEAAAQASGTKAGRPQGRAKGSACRPQLRCRWL